MDDLQALRIAVLRITDEKTAKESPGVARALPWGTSHRGAPHPAPPVPGRDVSIYSAAISSTQRHAETSSHAPRRARNPPRRSSSSSSDPPTKVETKTVWASRLSVACHQSLGKYRSSPGPRTQSSRTSAASEPCCVSQSCVGRSGSNPGGGPAPTWNSHRLRPWSVSANPGPCLWKPTPEPVPPTPKETVDASAAHHAPPHRGSAYVASSASSAGCGPNK
mmetsp:Transcript_8322/g.34278  ORF Transcript_8322/g.34278 Transcript_8322/m.34278 type:complete len:221 (-) Transcript_8322:394-1056(-)